jgi:hypothetical protein
MQLAMMYRMSQNNTLKEIEKGWFIQPFFCSKKSGTKKGHRNDDLDFNGTYRLFRR